MNTRSLLLTLLLLLGGASASMSQAMKWVTGYYPHWWYAEYNPGVRWDGTPQGRIVTPDVDFTKLTHIVIFSSNPKTTAPYLDVLVSAADSAQLEYGVQTGQPAPYLATTIRNAHAVGTKVILSLGGIYGQGASNMTWICQDTNRINVFVEASLAYAKRKGFDGVELDWEFPRQADQVGHNILIQKLRAGLDQWTPRGELLGATYARTDESNDGGVYRDGNSFGYTRDIMLACFDQINLMSYTMWQGNDQDYRAGFNTPINTPSTSEFPNYNGYSLTDADPVTGKNKGSVQTWTNAGYPADRLGMSLSLETSVFNGVSTMGQKYSSFSFGDFSDVPASPRYWNTTAQSPWYSDGSSKVITYEDTVSCRLKVEWARTKGMGGVMMYQLGSAFLPSAPTGKKDQLLQAVYAAAMAGSIPTEPPPVPVLSSPTDNATGQSTSAVLSWGVSAGASTYHVQVSTSSTFGAGTFLVNDSTVLGTTLAIAGAAYSTSYYWRVRAKNLIGYSAFTSAWSFTTAAAPQVPPATPMLSSPSNGATGQSLTVPLRWRVSSTATSYHLQVSTSSTFSAGTMLTNDSTIVDTVFASAGLQYSTQYYWRVRAGNTYGWSSYSSSRSFTTMSAPSPPSAPTLSAPSNGAIGQSLTVVLRWRVSTGAATYHLQLSTSSSFTSGSLLVNDSTRTDTSYTPTGLQYSTQYYWRVRAGNAYGWSTYSSSRSFTTTDPTSPPASPALVAPSNGATNQSITVNLRWRTASTATSYHLQVATASTFTSGSLVINDSTLADTTYVPAGFLHSTQYYWRVRARNVVGYGSYSTSRSFTTEAAPLVIPNPPTLVSPANGATDQAIDPSLRWTAVSGASSYHVQLATSSTFSAGTLVLNDSTATDTLRTVTGLTHDTQYHWRVRAGNMLGWSAYASPRTFTTGQPPLTPPDVPVLLSPANGAVDQSPQVLFRWHSVPTTTAYNIQVATNATFASDVLVADDAGVGDTTWSSTALTHTTTYFWRVRAGNDAGVSAFTVPWSFTTGDSTVSPLDSSVTKMVTMRQNFPNPFNPSTTISFTLLERRHITLRIYNVLGREVATLVDEDLPPGLHRRAWDAEGMPSGVYYCRVLSYNSLETISMLLVK